MVLTEIGGYRLERELGSGGMGVVYLGYDRAGQPVAIKVLHPYIAGDVAARARLAREVRTLRRIRHPRIAEVYYAELDAERPFIVTQYVAGPTLSADVRSHGPFDEAELVHFGHALLDALEAVHAAGVVHRDLKPANVMIADGEPMVIDFGIAQAADDVQVTATGLVMGTPGYLSPELADGHTATPATDWWGWGATVAFAASGRNPFGSGPLEAVLGRVAMGRAQLDGVPARFVPLLTACLDPDPAARPAAAQILSALVDIEAGQMPVLPVAADAPTTVLPGSGAGSGVPGNTAATRVVPAATRVMPAEPPTRVAQAPVGPAYHPTGHAEPVARAEPGGPVEPGRWGAPAPGIEPYRTVPVSDPSRPWPGESEPYRRGEPYGAGQQYRPQPRPSRASGGWMVFALAVLAVCLSATAPVIVLLAAYAWQLLARPAAGVVARRIRRASFYGPPGRTGIGDFVGVPGGFVVAVLTSALSMILPVLAAGAVTVLVSLGIVDWLPGGTGEHAALLAGGVTGGVVLWLGPGGRNLRSGSAGLARGITAGNPWAQGIVTVVLLVLALVAAVTGLSDETVYWWPLTVDPLEWANLAQGGLR
ncbi:protein kinase [Brevibacterium sp. 91QC2O2]|uniref:protein kinase domain-containing protein n=1 Tax=Brevibacterium sp. 91QC2O2 TaxID=2968458 RepID=UPI00211CAB0A|nr:serine/threonine-protein kinase [Brevibacterium sp. 91QC2O2]MCQ9369068.1 protein kinase [Brevibacterium sp. 91QC2O2]